MVRCGIQKSFTAKTSMTITGVFHHFANISATIRVDHSSTRMGIITVTIVIIIIYILFAQAACDAKRW